MKTDLAPVQKTADRIRDELFMTLKELDRRRQRAMDIKARVLEHQPLLRKIGLGVFAVAVLVGGAIVTKERMRRTRLPRERVRSLQRAWTHPERLASRSKPVPLGAEVGKRLVIAFVSALAQPLAMRAAANMFPRSPRT